MSVLYIVIIYNCILSCTSLSDWLELEHCVHGDIVTIFKSN